MIKNNKECEALDFAKNVKIEMSEVSNFGHFSYQLLFSNNLYNLRTGFGFHFQHIYT